ncbi:MAG: hypothetical protein JXK05_12190 [Campylobacterales bacterium]|nr:hypothetical protein [Campylobacterales bacterium]
MLLFGHQYIPSERLFHVDEIEKIAHTPPNSLLLVTFAPNALELITHMRAHTLSFALEVASLKEAIFAHNLGSAYIVTSSTLAKTIQKCAEHYLFDAKILCRIERDEEIEALALEGIDGVLYPQAVIRV